ncbi:SDR family NAD(P)-dependent oxidoreductase [Rouxiella sp. Mn2063]|uniref:SDR family NAD(P)-dependent oxidoreductase n=1 Tax=Rouxiella sp. Mn2063 TaxID=3395262 RepID=UPI003BE371AD
MTTSAHHTAPLALITGASSGIGATYAERLAKRGYDLVLVARDRVRMEALAVTLRKETDVTISILPADLANLDDLRRIEAFIEATPQLSLLVNNAGATLPGGMLDNDVDALDQLIRLNITALTRLARAAAPGLLNHPHGAIINIASVLGLAPELGSAIYPATKSFVLTLSQSLQIELGPRGLYVQAVLPAVTRTEIWQRSGRDVNQLKGIMEVDELVDAALVAFDKKELVTIPPLQDEKYWLDYEIARKAMHPEFRREHAAPRYHK